MARYSLFGPKVPLNTNFVSEAALFFIYNAPAFTISVTSSAKNNYQSEESK